MEESSGSLEDTKVGEEASQTDYLKSVLYELKGIKQRQKVKEMNRKSSKGNGKNCGHLNLLSFLSENGVLFEYPFHKGRSQRRDHE